MLGGSPLLALLRNFITLGGAAGLVLLLGRCRFPLRKAVFWYGLFYGVLLIGCTLWYKFAQDSFMRYVIMTCFLSSVAFHAWASGDRLSVTLFNLSMQFFLSCFIIILGYWAAVSLFEGSPWADMLIRMGLFVAVGVAYWKRFRALFRQVVDSPFGDWSFFTFAAVCISLFFLMYLLKPVAISHRPVKDQFVAAGMAVILMLMFVLIFKTLGQMLLSSEARRENELITMNTRLLRRQLDLQEEALSDARRMRHDLRHHNAAIAEYARRGDTEGLLRYLEQSSLQAGEPDLRTYCANAAVNNILAVYVRRAQQSGVELSMDLSVPTVLPVAEADLVVLLANLLENAMEGCERLEGERKKDICLHILSKNDRLLIQVENGCVCDISFDKAGIPVSSKESGVGAGSILKTAEKYGGHATFYVRQGRFIARVLLNL